MHEYPAAKRIAVLAACDAGKGTREVAREFHCSESWVRRLKQRRREGKPQRLFTRRPRRPPRWIVYEDQIDELMRNDPKMTLRELKAELDTDLSLPTLSRAIQHLTGRRIGPEAGTTKSRTMTTTDSANRLSSG